MKKPVIMTLGAFLIFLAGLGIGALVVTPTKSQETVTTNTGATEIHKKGKLTSPLLAYDLPGNVGGKEFGTYEKKLREKVDMLIATKKVSHISVYFRNLLDGGWIGINETEKFTPASLLKVPNMITLLKEAEKDPTLLKRQLVYTKKLSDGIPYFPATKTLEMNTSYTVEELIERMVKYSDNEAMYLLRDNFDATLFNQLYIDLSIATPDDTISDDFMTVKTYASFFRILYNASYLSIDSSEKALEILTQTDFKNGLVAGVPKNTIVAHKFGERTYTDDGTKQLHDCGIIYHPNDPYLLCVMTRGDNFDTLVGVIKDTSASVWNEMQSHNVVNK
jgi:beta-lactamase class A